MPSIQRFVLLVVMTLPLSATVFLNGCDSPVGPKFPDPIEEPDTTKQEGEGMTRRYGLQVRPVPAQREVQQLITRWCAAQAPCR